VNLRRQTSDPRPSAWPVLLVMCVGYFLVLLDVTVVNVALPQIGTRLGADVDGLQWVVNGYAVPLAALLLLGGTLGDVRGHKRVVLTGLGVFGMASLLCGLAPSTAVLVGGRVAQGVGAALLLPGTLAIITDSVPERARQARAIGVWAAVGSAALPAGPLLGGALVQALTWRAVFLLNLPVVLVAGLVAHGVVAEHRERAGRRLDWPGACLGGLLLATVVVAVVDAGHTGLSVRTLTAAPLAVVLLVAFIVAERSRLDPMLPLGLFRRPAFTTANLVAGAMNLGTLGLLFLLTLYLQNVQQRSPLSAGLALLPLFLPLSMVSPFAGRVTARLGPRLPMITGLVVAAAGVALLARVEPGSAYLVLLPAILAWGIGLGLLTPAVVAAALAAVGPGRPGLASGINNTARQAGGAVGIAAYGAVAGSPSAGSGFVTGLHLLGLATAGLFLAAAVATAALVPGRDRGHAVPCDAG
jgi:MFS transporter, DHA2 family, methylenomycin A resistance protein